MSLSETHFPTHLLDTITGSYSQSSGCFSTREENAKHYCLEYYFHYMDELHDSTISLGSFLNAHVPKTVNSQVLLLSHDISNPYLTNCGKLSQKHLEHRRGERLLQHLQQLLRLSAHGDRIGQVVHALFIFTWKADMKIHITWKASTFVRNSTLESSLYL